MLEVKNLTVSVEGNTILNGLNLTVQDGEVAAIMGPNGTGKSTLAYVIAGKEDYDVEWARSSSMAKISWRSRPTSAPLPACSWPSNTRARSPASAP